MHHNGAASLQPKQLRTIKGKYVKMCGIILSIMKQNTLWTVRGGKKQSTLDHESASGLWHCMK
jgi:hypothetical protein